VGFAALVGCLFVLSPLTGAARLLPSLGLGVIAGTAVFVARLRRPPHAATRTFAAAPASVLLVLAAAALLFAPAAMWLYGEYTFSIWRNGHGLFVAFFMVLLARSALRRDAGTQEESSAWGFAFLLPSLALLIVDAGVRSHYLSSFALVLALPGLSLLLLGARRTRRLALPLALGIFLIPAPPSWEHTLALSRFTAIAAEPILTALELPVMRHQTLLRMPMGELSVGQNCSGLSALQAGLAFAVLLAATARSRLRGALLVLAVYPLVLALNTLRAVFLVLLTLRYGGDVIHLPIHGLSGIAVFAGTVLALWLFADHKALREALS
jgi:exosortase